MTVGRKKRISTVLRLVICVVALWYVLRGVSWHDRVVLAEDEGEWVGRVLDDDDPVIIRLLDERIVSVPRPENGRDLRIVYGLRTAWMGSHRGLLLLAVLIHLPVVLPQALRFCLLLAAQGIVLRYRECLKLSFAGNFLNFTTPLGSHAGDVFKAYFVTLHTARKTEAVTTVILDRVVGLMGLLLVVTLITAFSPADSRLGMLKPYILSVLGLGAVGAAVYFAPWTRRILLTILPLKRFQMFTHLDRVDRAARTLFRRKGILLAGIGLTVLLQGIAMCAYVSVALAIGLDINADNVLEACAYFYTGVFVQALPGPPQGLGTVELTYLYFFSGFGSPSQIVSVALAIRVVALLCALPGLIVTLTGAYRPRTLADAEGALLEELSEPDVTN